MSIMILKVKLSEVNTQRIKLGETVSQSVGIGETTRIRPVLIEDYVQQNIRVEDGRA